MCQGSGGHAGVSWVHMIRGWVVSCQSGVNKPNCSSVVNQQHSLDLQTNTAAVWTRDSVWHKTFWASSIRRENSYLWWRKRRWMKSNKSEWRWGGGETHIYTTQHKHTCSGECGEWFFWQNKKDLSKSEVGLSTIHLNQFICEYSSIYKINNTIMIEKRSLIQTKSLKMWNVLMKHRFV